MFCNFQTAILKVLANHFKGTLWGFPLQKVNLNTLPKCDVFVSCLAIGKTSHGAFQDLLGGCGDVAGRVRQRSAGDCGGGDCGGGGSHLSTPNFGMDLDSIQTQPPTP